jgi:PAS domain-containing protein
MRLDSTIAFRDARECRMAQPVELILARQLASSLTVPILIVDARGDTLFYNEPAEAIFGRRFDEIDVLPFEERTAMFAPRRQNGEPLPAEQLPGILAMRQRRPAHDEFFLHDFNGELRAIEATAIPIEGASGDVLGTMVVLCQGPMARP